MMTELVWKHGGVTGGGMDFSKLLSQALTRHSQKSSIKLTLEQIAHKKKMLNYVGRSISCVRCDDDQTQESYFLSQRSLCLVII